MIRSDAEKVFEQRLREIFVDLEYDDFILNDRKVLSPYELDVYIPKLSMAFEFQGPHHYRDSTVKMLDEWKQRRCKKLHIRLFRYPCFNGLRIEDVKRYIFENRQLKEGTKRRHVEFKSKAAIRHYDFEEFKAKLNTKIKKKRL